jgi:hypothetical protein
MFIPNLMEARLHKTLKMNEKKKCCGVWIQDCNKSREIESHLIQHPEKPVIYREGSMKSLSKSTLERRGAPDSLSSPIPKDTEKRQFLSLGKHLL